MTGRTRGSGLRRLLGRLLRSIAALVATAVTRVVLTVLGGTGV